MTLTLQHSTDALAPLLAKLYASFRRLQRTKLWKQHVTGGVAFVEVKRSSRTESWHPHLHVLVQGKFLDRKLLQWTWHNITGDSYVVDIRLPSGPRGVARYVTKYASKPLNTSFLHDPLLLDEAMLALRGKRLCATFGCFRGLKLMDKPDEDAWTNVGPLTDWIRRAVGGDVEAQNVLKQIDPGRMDVCLTLAPIMEPHPPPEPPPPPDPQEKLFDTYKLHWQYG